MLDPAARTSTGESLGLQPQVIQRPERLILPLNPPMQNIQRLGRRTRSSPEPSITLQWHEGVNRVAAIVHEHLDEATAPRAVVIRHACNGRPQYINPLSCLYGPSSYPLRYPYGGRGWSTDVSHNGMRVSQVWWHRQQLLHLGHMHSCRRLLNEWLINMYCRMEDERLAFLRQEQSAKTWQRVSNWEAAANESALQTGISKSYYLPSTVPGTPGHLRRLRAEAVDRVAACGVPCWPKVYFVPRLSCQPCPVYAS